MLEQLERDAVGAVAVDVVEQRRLQAVGLEVADLGLVPHLLVEVVRPPDLALQGR